ncbi:hypothetical protein XI08_17295 [Bradyrhizobium sp. CCBAU 11361]|nr:hypothetical protein [Bradyrhizobium sp. CCBAU 11361]
MICLVYSRKVLARLGTQFFHFPCFSRFVISTRSPRTGARLMEIFRAEKICVVEDNSIRTCRICGKKMKLVRAVVDSESGGITRMFECPCGKRVWDD